MKKELLVILGILCLTLNAHAAKKMPVFFSFGGEYIEKYEELPNTPDFQRPDGTHVDIGVICQQLTIFFVPIWSWKKRYCGYVGNGSEYIAIDQTELRQVALSQNIVLPETPPLSWWQHWGGKLLLLLVVGFFVLFK